MSVKDGDVLPTAQRIRTPEEELMVLSELSETTYFVVLKRCVRRFVESYKNTVFLLDPTDPKLAARMGKLTDEAQGMNRLIKLIEGARGEIAKRNGDKI